LTSEALIKPWTELRRISTEIDPRLCAGQRAGFDLPYTRNDGHESVYFLVLLQAAFVRTSCRHFHGVIAVIKAGIWRP